MQEAEIIRFCDYEKRSREPDAAHPRNPVDADVIILPVLRPDPVELPCDVELEIYGK